MKAQKQASATEELKRQIGRYSIERLLARGGMAEVFIGRALGPAGFSKRVVIKRILPNLAQNGEFISMFMNEAKLAALLDHPNIVQVFDFGRHSSTYYIAMEYVEGENLRTIMLYYAAQQRRIPVAPVLVWVQGVCEALAYAHKLKAENGDCHNIVHRDISPDNILVSNSGIAKVVDFGVARASTLQRDLTTAGVVKGKFAYIPPEQILGQPVDQRVDIYSLGVTLYEVLVGRRPHVASNDLELVYSIMNTEPEPPHLARPEIDIQLSNIISRTIARDPKDRYPDMLAVYADIDDYLKSHGLRVKRSELSEIVAQVSQWSVNSSRNRDDSSSWNWDDWEGEEEAPPTMVFNTEEANPTTILSKPSASQVTPDPVAKGGTRRKLGLVILFVSLLVAVIAGGLYVLPERSPPPTPITAPVPVPETTPLPAPKTTSVTTPKEKPVTVVDAPSEDPSSQSSSSASPSTSPTSDTKTPVVASKKETKPPVKSSPKSARTKRRKASVKIKPAKISKSSLVSTVEPGSLRRLKKEKPVVPVNPPKRSKSTKAPSSATVKSQLSPAPKEVTGDGWLNLRTEPWCEVYLSGERIGTTPLNHLVIPAGRYWLKLVNKSAGIEKAIQVEIRPGEVSTTRLRLVE